MGSWTWRNAATVSEKLIEVDGSRASRDDAETKELLKSAMEYAQEYNFLPIFNHYWAKKKNKTWMKVNDELAEEMKRMYEQGEGYKNKATRYTPEQAVAELREKFLVDKWDQRVIVSVKILKGKFSVWFRKEKKKGDDQRDAAAEVDAAATKADEVVLTDEAAAAFALIFNEDSDVQLNDNVGDDVREAEDFAVGMAANRFNDSEE